MKDKMSSMKHGDHHKDDNGMNMMGSREMLRKHAGYYAADSYDEDECWCKAGEEHGPKQEDGVRGGY